DLVEEQKTRDFRVFEFAQDKLELRHLAVVGLANHYGRIDRRQDGAHVVDEFNRARTIKKRVAVAHEGGRGGRELHAHLGVARFLARVADRGSGFDRALTLYRAGAGKNRFQERGFAALERPHQRDTPWASRPAFPVSHKLPPSKSRSVPPPGLLFYYRFRGI